MPLPTRLRLLVLSMLLLPATGAVADDDIRRHLKHSDDWFASSEAKRIAANVLTYQTEAGGWPKNTDTVSRPFDGDHSQLLATFDNKGTVDELRFMARMVTATGDTTYRSSFDRGLAFVLAAQYPNGGWPQFFPLRGGYHDHITFNDGAMVRVLVFVREVAREKPYAFVDAATRKSCQSAFERGIACVLRCQIVVDDAPTVWCAQHDEHTFAPAKARSYELPSFSGQESVGIVRLLMSVDRPTPKVRAAVEAAVAWLEAHSIKGQRLVTDRGEDGKPDIRMVADPDAPALWARFYDLASGEPFVCDRDGIPREGLADLGYERRNGYSWFGAYARDLLEIDYPRWKKADR